MGHTQQILARHQERARHALGAEVPDWYRITAKADSRKAKVYIYAAIGGWFGIDAQQFVREINDLDVDEIELHVNSPGGSAFDGIAIRNALRQHDASVTCIVDGLAASAASIIALAGETTIMAAGSQLMIHDAGGICLGNAQDMRDLADVLDKISNSYAGLYAAKAGGTSDAWRDVMRAETWYTAEEAVTAGLADAVDKLDDAEETGDDATARFDLSIFAYAGRDQAPPPQIFTSTNRLAAPAAHTPPAEPADHTNPQRKESAMPDTLKDGLRDRLGISADAELTDEQYLAALEEALTERADPAQPTATAPGTVNVDEETYTQLRADAQAGREARQRQLTDDRARAVDAAITDGRILPARRDAWLAQLEADPGMAEVLNKLEKGVMPTEPIGHTGGVAEASDDDAFYNKVAGATGGQTKES